MQKIFVGLVLSAMLALPLLAAPKPEASTMPKVGDMAPNFTLNYFDSAGLHSVSLDQYRGKKQVVLAFYVFAFTGG